MRPSLTPAVLITLCALVSGTPATPSSVRSPIPAPSPSAPELPPGLAAAIHADGPGRFVLAAGRVDARVDRAGAHLGDGARVSLAGWGRDGRLAVPAATDPELRRCGADPRPGCRSRLEYRHGGGLTAWWTAKGGALEQGFDVAAPPSGAGPLVFDLALDGADGLRVQGETAGFTSSDSRPWRVTALAAWDADRRPLPAAFRAAGDGLRIEVDDRGARYPLVVDPLYDTPMLTLTGSSGSEFGTAVAGGGDFDGDGYDDIAISAPWADVAGDSDGAVYVHHGGAAGLSATATLTLSDSTTTGENYGFALAGDCDYDGDGYDDLAVGAPDFDDGEELDTGRVLVYWGSAAGLDATDPWTYTPDKEDQHFGYRVACAGDVDGDGLPDLAASMPYYSGESLDDALYEEIGRVYVFYGSADRMASQEKWSRYGGTGDSATHPHFGWALAAPGDTDGDGFDDLAIGSPRFTYGGFGSGDRQGNWRLYLGDAGGLPEDYVVSVRGYGTDERMGSSLAGGDFDSDGYGDVAYGTPRHHDPDRGAFWVRPGSAAGIADAATVDVSGEDGGDEFADVLACPGDVNADGYDDLLVAAPGYPDGDALGKVYLFGGSDWGLQESVVSTFVGESALDSYGTALSGGGDVDGNGYTEVLVGAPLYGADNKGKVYVYTGYADDDQDADGVATDADCDDLDPDVGGWQKFYNDDDGDGYGEDDGRYTISCGLVYGASENADDCDDEDPTIHPGADEVCDLDDVDEDCDGDSDDEDPDVVYAADEVWYYDVDGDSFGVDSDAVYGCSRPEGHGDGGSYVGDAGDCDDADPSASPGFSEVCDADDTDEDCDGLADNDDPAAAHQSLWGYDADGDGYGDPENYTFECDSPGAGWVDNTTDCDDTDPSGGVADYWYIDFDGDGYGAVWVVTWSCGQPDDFYGYEFVFNNRDCDDNTAEVGAPTWYYPDADADGYGGEVGSFESCDDPGAGYVEAPAGDCDDADAAVSPAASETCDGIDNDCDGSQDEGYAPTLWYADDDGDGWGDPADSVSACTQPAGYVSNDLDCNDALDYVHTPPWNYLDADGDGYGLAGTGVPHCGAALPGYVRDNDDDCDDSDASVNPAGTEECDGVDEDCDGTVDEGFPTSTWYADADADGWGDADASVDACYEPDEHVSNDDDCDDTRSYVHTPYWHYVDADGDGTGLAGTGVLSCEAELDGYARDDDSDCDDTDATVSPVAPEVCDAADVDEDCDGLSDDADASATGQTTTYGDADGDGWGDPAIAVSSCEAPIGYVIEGTDCDDADAAVHPGATETCDGVDDDCDGGVDEHLDADADGVCDDADPDADGDGCDDGSDADPSDAAQALTWSEAGRVRLDGGAYQLGNAVALEGDTLLAGAWNEVRVYARAGGAWNWEQGLVPDGGGGSFWGADVALSGDRAVVGDPQHGGGPAAWVFEKGPGGTWSQSDALVPSVANDGAWDVDVALAGDVAAVGRPDPEQLFVFEYEDGSWVEVLAVEGSPAGGDADFGRALAVDGERVAVGAPWADGTGAVYVYEADAGGDWSLAATVQPGDGVANAGFGYAVDLEGDRLVVGAPWAGSGEAWVFVWDGAAYTDVQTLTPGAGESQFGEGVALDGHRLAVLGEQGSQTAVHLYGREPDDTFTSYGATALGATWVWAEPAVGLSGEGVAVGTPSHDREAGAVTVDTGTVSVLDADGDGVDDDCDACPVDAANDADGDGYCAVALDATLEDCDDADPGRSPAATEVCGDGHDQDCDGAADEECAADCTIFLASPADGADLTDAGRFRWAGDCDAYRVEVSADPTFPADAVFLFGTLADAAGSNLFTVNSTAWSNVGRYATDGAFWRVVGVLDDRTTTSETRSFYTTLAPRPDPGDPVAGCTVSALGPADGTEIASPPTFTWSTDCNAAYVEVSDHPDFPLESTLYLGGVSTGRLSMGTTMWDAVDQWFVAGGGYWRLTSEALEGVVHSEVRTFTVP